MKKGDIIELTNFGAGKNETYKIGKVMVSKMPKNDHIETPITLKEVTEQIPNLKITKNQKEFVKAALRACCVTVLEKRIGCKIDI